MYTIVVGVDGSRASWRALAMATGIARRECGAVYACYVVHIPAAAELGVFAVPVPPAVDGDGSELREEVEQELAGAGAPGTFSCRRGDIARELEALAEERRADLIVVGRSRHPSLHLGAAPRRLLAMGRRPVLVVP